MLWKCYMYKLLIVYRYVFMICRELLNKQHWPQCKVFVAKPGGLPRPHYLWSAIHVLYTIVTSQAFVAEEMRVRFIFCTYRNQRWS